MLQWLPDRLAPNNWQMSGEESSRWCVADVANAACFSAAAAGMTSSPQLNRHMEKENERTEKSKEWG